MKSKSIVQERLEAGRNRLEVISREVDAARMSVPELQRGLRQVGTYLESMQRMINTDTNVKFQEQINKKLEVGMKHVEHVIKNLGGITGADISSNLVQVNRALDSVQEYVDLEIEDLL